MVKGQCSEGSSQTRLGGAVAEERGWSNEGGFNGQQAGGEDAEHSSMVNDLAFDQDYLYSTTHNSFAGIYSETY